MTYRAFRSKTRNVIILSLIILILTGYLFYSKFHSPSHGHLEDINSELDGLWPARHPKSEDPDRRNPNEPERRHQSIQREIASYVKKLKQAEARSADLISVREVEDWTVVEILLDCDQARRNSNLIDRDHESRLSEDDMAGAREPFDHGDASHVFMELKIRTSTEGLEYQYITFHLDSIDDLVPIEGTVRHYAKTSAKEWSSADDSMYSWRYDIIADSIINRE